MKIKLLLTATLACMTYFTADAENFFATLLGKTDKEVEARLDKVWNHFFTPGDLSRYEADGERSVYYENPDGTAFIMDTGNNDVRSEGMSYGMMISVQLDRREQFDKLWEWSKRHMAYEAGTPWDGYFCWQCRTDGTKTGGSNASDGELYFVTALFLAAERWNEPRYAEDANSILHKIMNKDGDATGVYNLYNRDNHQITFVPDRNGHMFSDPSYHLPAFLDKWSRCAASEHDFWKEAATAARKHLMDSSHPDTGLYPDYSEYDGRGYRWPHAGYDTSIYMYDAIRCAMNVGMDYYLCGADKANQAAAMKRLLTFFKNDGFRHSHFALDGSNSFGGYTQGMDGANAVGAIALADSPSEADRELALEYVRRLWDTEPPTGKYRYYEGMVYFLSMLHVSGHFNLDF